MSKLAVEQLRARVARELGCDAQHVQTQHVTSYPNLPELGYDGPVHEFALTGHAAARAWAWGDLNAGPIVCEEGVPFRIDSAQKAVDRVSAAKLGRTVEGSDA